MRKFHIELTPYSEDRFFEVFRSMPKPRLAYEIYHGPGVPTVTAKCWNHEGVVIYTYQHSGKIGMQRFINRLEGIES